MLSNREKKIIRRAIIFTLNKTKSSAPDKLINEIEKEFSKTIEGFLRETAFMGDMLESFKIENPIKE